MRLGCSECFLGFRKDLAWISQGIRIDFAKKLHPNRLLEVQNPSRRVQNRLQIVWRTAERCPKAQKTSIFFVTFSLIWGFFGRQRGPQEWPRDPKDTPRGAQMPPEVPRESPMRPLETLRGPFSRVQSRCRSKRNAIVAFRAHSGGFSDDVGLPRSSSDMRFVS